MLIDLKRNDFEPIPGECFVELVGGRLSGNEVALDFVVLDWGQAKPRHTTRTLHHRFTLDPQNALDGAQMAGSLHAFRFGYLDHPFVFDEESIAEKVGNHYRVTVRETKDCDDESPWRLVAIDLEAGVTFVSAQDERTEVEVEELLQGLSKVPFEPMEEELERDMFGAPYPV